MIRRATADDLGAMTRLLMDYPNILREHHFGEPNVDTIQVAMHIYLNSPNGFAFVDEAEDGKLNGLIVCHTFCKPVTGLLTCIEVHWGTRPECPSRGLDLKRAAEREATERGAASMMISAPEANDRRVGTILERSGYTPIMTVYEKAL